MEREERGGGTGRSRRKGKHNQNILCRKNSVFNKSKEIKILKSKLKRSSGL